MISVRRFSLFGLLCLVTVSVTGWLWFSRISERVLANLDEQTGLTFINDTVSFDPWQRRLSASDIQLKEGGIQLTARQINIALDYRHWWDFWLGENVESLTAIELFDANIAIDPTLITTLPPEWFQSLSINKGTLSITGIEPSLPFHQLTLIKAGESRLNVQVDQPVVNTAADDWRFSGAYDVSQQTLSGQLSLEGLPLSALLEVISPGASSVDRALSGTINARLSLSWDKHNGLVLEGRADGQQGQFIVPGIAATWQQWQLENVRFARKDSARSGAGLSVSGLDLKLAEASLVSVDRLTSALPFSSLALAVNDSRLELEVANERGASPWIFENLNGSLVSETVPGRGASQNSWQYQADAFLSQVGQFRISGKLSRSDNDYRFTLNDAHLAGPLTRYSPFAGYTMQGSEFNLSYNSQSRSGQLDLVDWQYRKLVNGPPSPLPVDLLKALVTEKSGRAVIPFLLPPGQSKAPLAEQIGQAIEQRFTAIARAPFDYLSRTTGYTLEPVLRHQNGKVTLTPSSRANLERLQKALGQRPGLSVLIDVGVSESADWPELSRHELEAALQELYSATGAIEKSGASIPSRVRAQLMEQMYLAIRHQKIPEVGVQSAGQRVEQAETWLLKNWPRTPDQILTLQQARYDFLEKEAGRIGIDGKRIALALSPGSGRNSVTPQSMLTLH